LHHFSNDFTSNNLSLILVNVSTMAAVSASFTKSFLMAVLAPCNV